MKAIIIIDLGKDLSTKELTDIAKKEGMTWIDHIEWMIGYTKYRIEGRMED